MTPMFPLQMVLLPGAPLGLRVFEPRYLTMLEEVLGGDGAFGVVMIERGSEVGGGDVRCDVGTMARVLEAAPIGGGQWGVTAAGAGRFRVRRWLADDPYPRAEVQDWPDEDDAEPSAETLELTAELPGLVAAARALMAQAHGLPEPGPVDLGDDPGRAAYGAAAAAPIGPLDRFAVLGAPTAAARTEMVHRLVSEQIELLQGRIAMTDG